MPVNLLLENDQIVASLQHAMGAGVHSLHVVPGLIKRVIGEERWKERTVRVIHQEARFERFEDFVAAGPPEGLGTTLDAVMRLCRDDAEAIDAIDRVTVGKQGGHKGNQYTNGNRNNITVSSAEAKRGTASQYALRRLRKDYPDLHARVLAGELTPHGGMVEAGFLPRTATIRLDRPESVGRILRQHFSPEQIIAMAYPVEARS